MMNRGVNTRVGKTKTQVVMMCKNLRDSRQLRQTLQHAVVMIFPRSMAAALLAIISHANEYPVPSASTVSHARFTFDMGLLLCQRIRFTRMLHGECMPRPVLFGMTDSSPIGGMNWQNTSFYLVGGDRLLQVASAAVELVRLRGDGLSCERFDEEVRVCLDAAHVCV